MNIADETLAGVIEDALQTQSDIAFKAGVDETLDFVEAVLIVRMNEIMLERLVVDSIVAIMLDIRKELQS